MRIRLALVVPALALGLGTAVASVSVALDGRWEMWRAADGALPPKSAKWTSVKVPSFVPHAAGLPFIWFRRSFSVPRGFAGKHLFLRFGGVKFVSEVYLNGQKVGGHFGGWEPFELDVTGVARLGRPNDLLVRVQGISGVIAQPLDYSRWGRGVRLVDQVQGAIMAPVGSQYHHAGIWQPVKLLARGDVFVEDVFIKTSVRRKELEAEVTLRNLTDKPRVVRLEASVVNWPKHEGPPLLGLGPREVTVPAQSSTTDVLRRTWRNPRLWSLDSPALYVLSVRLKEGGKAAETFSQRFGFREFWCEGPNLVLNGAPIHFLATAGHPRGDLDGALSKKAAIDFYRRIRRAGCLAMRLHANLWPEWWYEAADEVGMPIIMESALFCNSRQYALAKPEFWRNYRHHLAAIIRHKRNHPAIVIYSLENEILHCGGDRFAPDCEHRLAQAGRLVKNLDPTRPIMYDADGDPEGVADVVNLHYPLDFDSRNLWPDCAWWLEKGMKVRGWPHKFFAWDRNKPLYIGEFLHLQHYVEADPYTTLLGDDAYLGHDQAMARCKALAWEMQIQAYRGCGVSGMCPWTLTETGDFPSPRNPRYLAVKRAYQPIAAFIRQYDHHFFAGQTVPRTINLYNDTLRPARLTLQWKLRLGDRVVDSGQRAFPTRPAQRITSTIELQMPRVAQRTALSLELRVLNGAEPAFEDRKTWWVFPRRRPRAPQGLAVAVFEGRESRFARLLHDAGAKVLEANDLARLPRADVLFIAPHALDDFEPAPGPPTVGGAEGPGASLANFVRGGGTVVVLEQSRYPDGLLPARLLDRGCTFAFRRTRDPVLLGATEAGDFRFWRGDHVVARKTLAKPTRGRFLAHLDSGGPDGLVYLPLLEVRDGKGRYLLSQLLIGEKLDNEPMATIMLENLLRCAATTLPGPKPLAVVQEKLPLTEPLAELEAEFTDLTGKLAQTDLSPFAALMVEADATEVADNAGKLRRFVERGGRLVVHAATPKGIHRIQKLFPEPLSAQPNSSIPVNIAARDHVIDGLANQDLYWYGDRSGLTWRVRTPLSSDVCDHIIMGRLPSPQACQTIQAEKMTPSSGDPQFRDREVYMYTSASIEATLDFPRQGDYAFILRGSGTPVAAVYPQIAISIDGQRRASVTLAGEQPGEYAATAHVSPGPHKVALAFVNDAWAPERGEDRNASLDWLRVGPVPPMKAKRLLNPPALVKLQLGNGFILLDQVRWDKRPGNQRAMRYLSNLLTNLACDFASPSAALDLTADAFKPKPGLRLASWRAGVISMGTNGTVATRVRFASRGTYSFAVKAWGTQAAGEFPNIALAIDGRKVAETTLRRPGWHTVDLAAPVSQGDHEVALSFTNDFYDPPQDRNLRIAGLRVRKLR